MEQIFSNKEADGVYDCLNEQDKKSLNQDKIRFGEYFIGLLNNQYRRLNPLNIVYSEGKLIDLSQNNPAESLSII